MIAPHGRRIRRIANFVICQSHVVYGTKWQAGKAGLRHVIGRCETRWHRQTSLGEMFTQGSGVGSPQYEVKDIDVVRAKFRPHPFSHAKVESLGARIDAPITRSAIAGTRANEDDAA